jgi:tripartite-type tricarboxylate transporter receptor subunit TctC
MKTGQEYILSPCAATNRAADVRFAFLVLAGVVAAGPLPPAHAQDPARLTLRVLVPLPAGSTSDVVARLIADNLREQRGRPVIVENRPGASGRIAVEALKSSAADGGTLLFAPIAVPVIVPIVFKDAKFDPANDLVPVAQVSRFEYALAVAANRPAQNLAAFLEWARANPKQANFGTPGAGSIPHFLGTALGRAGGIELTHVAYRGATAIDADLLGGQIAAGVSALSDFLALHRAGKLRILATSGERRSPLLPDVPTFREQGYPSVEAFGWHGVFAPGGTPRAVVDQLSDAIVAAARAPEVRGKLAALGIEPTGTTPERLAAIMAADSARWRAIVKETGFSAE